MKGDKGYKAYKGCKGYEGYKGCKGYEGNKGYKLIRCQLLGIMISYDSLSTIINYHLAIY